MDQKPVLFVIFGISGDLSRRKLLPALYRLIEQPDMPKEFKVIGISRQPNYNVENLFDATTPFITDSNSYQLQHLKDRVTIVHNALATDDDGIALRNTLEAESAKLGEGTQRIYYLSIPPTAFPPLVALLGRTGHNTTLSSEPNKPRLLVEKPFGYNSQSAAELIDAADREFGEEQIYRIDHYLARETAQNLLTFRFKNSLFDSIWDGRHISDIKIAAHEQIDIEGRANFYESVGALRDIIQSHLIQLLAFVMMDRPSEWTSAGIHTQKLAFLNAINPITPDQVSTHAVRGQYAGYRDAVNNPGSITETFARVNLTAANDQWKGTSITLETGKALSERSTYVEVTFRGSSLDDAGNTLTFCLQPNEGIMLDLQAKRPGLDNSTEPVRMDFDYKRSFDANGAQPYERVIMDAIKGDQTLFASGPEVIASWKIVDAVLSAWSSSSDGMREYTPGSKASDIL